MGQVSLALAVSVLAGLATALGGLLVLHPRAREARVLGAALAFAAGAMVAVSAAEILPRSVQELAGSTGPGRGWAVALAAGAAGAGLVLALDLLAGRWQRRRGGRRPDVPGPSGPTGPSLATRHRLSRGALLVTGTVALHNVPEGMSTFLATLADPATGIALAVAVAIHNVPEGVAVAAPVLGATGSRARAFWWAAASGAAEPLGALLGLLLIGVLLPEGALSVLFALVGGMMLMLSLHTLLPSAARELGSRGLTVAATASGAVVMLLSLALLA